MSIAEHISKELLDNGIDIRIRTRGSSMFPLIATGDRVIIRPEKNPETGDIIAFRRSDSMVCHRLVRVFEKDGIKYFQTCGDSFLQLDEPVTSDRIAGKVVAIERRHISLVRKLLLLIYPALRYGRLNAFLILTLTKIRNVFSSKEKK